MTLINHLIIDGLWQALIPYQKKGQNQLLLILLLFTHEALLILFKVIDSLVYPNGHSIVYLYNPAHKYSYDSSEVWLSKGLKDMRTVIGYPGRFKPYNRLHLSILVGYENERAKLTLESIEPNIISLGKAAKLESVNPDMAENNLQAYEDIKSMYKDVTEFEFSCLEPTKTA